MPRAIVLVVLGLALLGLGWILWGPKGKAGLDPAEGARFALGREDAPVVVVDFSNYLCPHCQNHALNVLPRLKAEYIDTGKVRYLFRDFPFPGQACAACLASGRHREEVLADQKLATDLGLTGTPTFFIAGEKHTGFLPYEEWKRLLDEALAKAE